MTKNLEQVVSVLHRAIQRVISHELNDPRVRGLVTVTDVKVSSDLAHATVLVSVLPEDQEQLTIHGLRHAAAHIRSRVGNLVDMRRVPQLTLKLDPSLKKAAHLDEALREVDDDPLSEVSEDPER